MKQQRYFNTSGPNIPAEHYTLAREKLISTGLDLVREKRYFTIWAPRQTGKSTYLKLLAEELAGQDYKVVHINVENYLDTSKEGLLKELSGEWQKLNGKPVAVSGFAEFSRSLKRIGGKFVLIVDEIEGLNPDIFSQFLHTIRNLYHSREKHCLKSVILAGVSNIIGIVQDNASPFNITNNLTVDYFTREEVSDLLAQHEEETGQLFFEDVKEKIFSVTAGQPGLVNGFARELVENQTGEKITYQAYLEVEHWYLYDAIDKNIANIISKAGQFRFFVEQLLFTERKVLFDIDREAVKFLHVNGLIKKDADGYIQFWVPLYKKRLFKAFYPHTNGESENIIRNLYPPEFMDDKQQLNFDKLINWYKAYVKRRGFSYFRERDRETGEYRSIKEAALVYSFETFIQAFLREVDGKSYLEAHAGAGRSDLILNVTGREYVVEVKIYSSPRRFADGKRQLAYYCRSLSLRQGIYLVFAPAAVEFDRLRVQEGREVIDGVEVVTYLVVYDLEKDF